MDKAISCYNLSANNAINTTGKYKKDPNIKLRAALVSHVRYKTIAWYKKNNPLINTITAEIIPVYPKK